MNTRIYLIGLPIALLTLAATLAYDDRTVSGIYVSSASLSYLVYSTLAFLVGRAKSRKSQGGVFFFFGLLLLFTYIPLLGHVVEFFYNDPVYSFSEEHRLVDAINEMFLYSFVIVASLCIFRGVDLWAKAKFESEAGRNMRAKLTVPFSELIARVRQDPAREDALRRLLPVLEHPPTEAQAFENAEALRLTELVGYALKEGSAYWAGLA